jgi:hypothetical protein
MNGASESKELEDTKGAIRIRKSKHDGCLAPKEQLFSYIMARISYISMKE